MPRSEASRWEKPMDFISRACERLRRWRETVAGGSAHARPQSNLPRKDLHYVPEFTSQDIYRSVSLRGPNLDKFKPELAEGRTAHRAKSAELAPNSTKYGPSSTNVGPMSSTESGPESAQSGPDSHNDVPKSDKCCPTSLVRLQANFGRFQTRVGRVSPKSLHNLFQFEPISVELALIFDSGPNMIEFGRYRTKFDRVCAQIRSMPSRVWPTPHQVWSTLVEFGKKSAVPGPKWPNPAPHRSKSVDVVPNS